MKILLNDITEEKKWLNVDTMPFSGKIFPDRLITEVDVDLCYYKAGETIAMTVKGTCDVKTICSRCSADIVATIEIDEFFPIVPDCGGNENEYTHNGTFIETNDFLRESLVIDIPEKILCNPSCRGLCPECGADLNIKSCKCGNKN